jgi:hypothetical protein
LLANTTWTLTREAVLRVRFPGILLYDGQGFMVAAAVKVATLADLDGATICVEKGTTHQRNLEAHFKENGRSVKPLLLASAQKAAAALFAGQCQAYTADSGELAAMRLRAPGGPGSFVILPERISREPLSPVVWGGDPEWATVIRWVLNILILGEEYGVTRDNLDAVDQGKQESLLRQNPYEGEMIARSMGIETTVGDPGPAGGRQLWRGLRAQRRARQSAQDRARSQPPVDSRRTPLFSTDRLSDVRMTDFQINLTIAVFAAVILCIAFDLVDMVVAALLGVSTLIVFGILEGSDLMPIVHTAGGPLSLLFGGMVVARVIGKTGIFERIGDLFLRATGGSGRRLLLLIVVLVAPLCAVLPNATAVILVAPIIVSVCQALKVDIVGPLIITAIVSNAAGMLTLVGDPATFLVGSAIGLSFLDYLRMVSLGGVLAVLAVVPLLPLLLPKIWAARVILPPSVHPLPSSDPVSWYCRCSCCCSW